MKRENFKSRLGFLLVSAGCAIGLGPHVQADSKNRTVINM